jgi:hypothetical protein
MLVAWGCVFSARYSSMLRSCLCKGIKVVVCSVGKQQIVDADYLLNRELKG